MTRHRSRWILALAIGITLPVLAAPQGADPEPESSASVDLDTRSVLESAVESYASGQAEQDRDRRIEHYRQAARWFGRATALGADTADVHANLGNSALQGEDLGQAVLAFRRALLRDPGHARSLQNLEHARTLLPHWLPTPAGEGVLDSFFSWHRTLSRDRRSLAAALSFLLLGACLAAAIVRRSSGLSSASVLPGLVWLALVLSLVFDPARTASHEGVVIARELPAHASDSINAPLLFGEALPAGTELRVEEDRGPWLRVRLFNGRTAWVRASGVARVRPESAPS